jgi:hypothetical protein
MILLYIKNKLHFSSFNDVTIIIQQFVHINIAPMKTNDAADNIAVIALDVGAAGAAGGSTA